METRHLVTLWNPSYGADVMEAHQRVLLDAAKAWRQGHRPDGDVYVWWAKIRSENRQQKLPHLADVLAIPTEPTRDDPGPETHLYLTDYRSLYVGHVGEITAKDPRQDKQEKRHIPKYYQQDRLATDCWFRLWDIRRLVADDTVSVVHLLRTLRNVRYHDRPVSIYGGMVDLPLIVTDTAGTRYFDPDYRAQLTGGTFWVEFDAERAGIGTMESELRENLFGDEVWHRLDPATRVFVATAEKVFRDHRRDSAFDLSPVVMELSKALEVTCTAVLRPVLSKAPPDVQALVPWDVQVAQWSLRPPSLCALATIVEDAPKVRTYLQRKLRHGDWFTSGLPAVLRAFAEVRNAVVHSRSAERAEVMKWRQQLLGIGCEGILPKLAWVEAF